MYYLFLIVFFSSLCNGINASENSILEQFGEKALKNQDYNAALTFYKQALVKKPGEAKIMFALAYIYRKTRDWQNARAVYQELTGIPETAAVAWSSLGQIALQSQDNAEALACFTKALQHNAEDPAGLAGKALTTDLMGDHLAAQLLYVRALEIMPTNITTQNNYALSLAITGEYEKAINILKGLSTQDTSSRSRLNLGVIYMLSGQSHLAEPIIKELSPRDRTEFDKQVSLFRRKHLKFLETKPQAAGQSVKKPALKPTPLPEAVPAPEAVTPVEAAAPTLPQDLPTAQPTTPVATTPEPEPLKPEQQEASSPVEATLVPTNTLSQSTSTPMGGELPQGKSEDMSDLERALQNESFTEAPTEAPTLPSPKQESEAAPQLTMPTVEAPSPQANSGTEPQMERLPMGNLAAQKLEVVPSEPTPEMPPRLAAAVPTTSPFLQQSALESRPTEPAVEMTPSTPTALPPLPPAPVPASPEPASGQVSVGIPVRSMPRIMPSSAFRRQYPIYST